jgi:hypothetical protein
MTIVTTTLRPEFQRICQSAAIVCSHVAKYRLPIKLALKNAPSFPEDSGWQFLCGESPDEDIQEAHMWSLLEVFKREPTLVSFLDVPENTCLRRDSENGEWYEVILD